MLRPLFLALPFLAAPMALAHGGHLVIDADSSGVRVQVKSHTHTRVVQHRTVHDGYDVYAPRERVVVYEGDTGCGGGYYDDDLDSDSDFRRARVVHRGHGHGHAHGHGHYKKAKHKKHKKWKKNKRKRKRKHRNSQQRFARY